MKPRPSARPLARSLPLRLLACLLPLAAAMGAPACSTPKGDASTIPETVPVWTEEFQERAMLIADRVRVEGPAGLLEHLATRPNPEFHDRNERTTPDGFVQEIESRVSGRGSEIYAWLDQLEIVALESLHVLEGPFLTDVVVEASGDVLLRPLDEDAPERREDSLRLVGKPPVWAR